MNGEERSSFDSHDVSDKAGNIKMSFVRDNDASAPLSELVRPRSLKDFVGQEHLLDEYGSIRLSIQLKWLTSMIFHGPPSVGKTTIAKLVANESGYVFCEFSATDSSIKDIDELRRVLKEENFRRQFTGEQPLKVVLFIDEVHRFSKVQQDFLLPYVESGEMVFFGATTMNPQSRLRSALISRCHVHRLLPLSIPQVKIVLERALEFENERRKKANLVEIKLDDPCTQMIIQNTIGDTRRAINLIEVISRSLISEDMTNDQANSPYEVKKKSLVKIINLFESSNSGLRHKSNAMLFSIFFDSLRRIHLKRKVDSYFQHRYLSRQRGMNRISKAKNKKPESTREPLVGIRQNSHDSFIISIKINQHHDSKNGFFRDEVNIDMDRSFSGTRNKTQGGKNRRFTFKESSNDNDSDSDFESFYDFFRCTVVPEDDPKFEWKTQIRNMEENRNEPTGIYSDDENHVKVDPYDIEEISAERYFRIASIYYALLLKKRGESTQFIAKQLILFAVIYLESNYNFLSKLMGFVKAMRTSSANIDILISNIISITFKEKLKDVKVLHAQYDQLKIMKQFWTVKFQEMNYSVDSEFNVFDMLNAEKYSECKDNDFSDGFNEIIDLTAQEDDTWGFDVPIQHVSSLDLDNDIINGSEYLHI